MRVLILGVDWHGDVARSLAAGFEAIDVDARVHYVLRQRRTGIVPRLVDELRASRSLGPGLLERDRAAATAATRAGLDRHSPDLVVCLSPELIPEAGVELIASSARACWWFGDDPERSARRGPGPAPLVRTGWSREALALVAHPAWAKGALASAEYLPYGSRFEPREPAFASGTGATLDCVVVGSPRESRRRLLAELAPALGDRLNVWGWGVRGRLPGAGTRAFRSRLRGRGPLDPKGLEAVYRAASVVLNLQDEQMLGAWNPQTFDLLALGVPQVVWNEEPVDYLEHPPGFAADPAELAELVRAALARPHRELVGAGFDEAQRRHRWSHRARRIASLAAEV